MIPKTIHYCWFGGKEKPYEVLKCIDTWRHILSDYDLKEWNESNFPYKKLKYTNEAYHIGKYAFVSDVCRLHALYTEGGVYLDTDIEVLKTFDPFLMHQSFIGYEVDDLLGTGVIGSVKGEPWLKEMLDIYAENPDFIYNDGKLNNTPNTIRVTELFKKLPSKQLPTVYPLDFFCAKHWKTEELFVTENTVCIHHYRASWYNNPVKTNIYEQRICDLLGIRNCHILTRLYKKYIALISIF